MTVKNARMLLSVYDQTLSVLKIKVEWLSDKSSTADFAKILQLMQQLDRIEPFLPNYNAMMLQSMRVDDMIMQ